MSVTPFPKASFVPATELGDKVVTAVSELHVAPKGRRPDPKLISNFAELRVQGGEDFTALTNYFQIENPIVLDRLNQDADLYEEIKTDSSQRLVSYGLADFLSLDMPERGFVLGPLLPEQGLLMVYAIRGLGKTWVALNMAYAIATAGVFLKWTSPKPLRVIYLDGEMPASVLQDRVAQIAAADDREIDPSLANNMKIVAQEMQDPSMPDLASTDGQAIYDQLAAEADVIFVDNISTLCRAGAENKADDWTTVSEWALRMRRLGKSLVFVAPRW